MKRFGRFAILLLVVGLFITCEKIEYDPFMPYTSVRPLEFSRNTQYEYFFDMKEDSSDLYFTANYVWLTEVPDSIASWFKIVPRRGKPGEQRVTFIIAKNVTNKVRTGHFSICSGDDSVRFAVTQLPPDFYVENEDTIIQLDHERQDSVLSFYANVEWTATVEEGAKSWLSIKEASGINENTKLEIHAERNDRDDDREGKIFINSKNSRCTIIVKQSHGQTFEFDTDTEISVGNEEGKDEFKFKSNVPDWEATTSDDWLEVTSETGGTGDITLQFSYKKSEEETERTGEITVRSGEASFVITVKQARARAFEFNEDTKFQYPVDNQYGTKTFEFKSNVSKWTATSSDDNWLRVEPEEGDKGDKLLIITYEETDEAYRAGSITVSDEKGDSTFVITVNQLSGRVFDFAPDTKFEYDVESELGTRKFKFISNVTKWEASPLDEWLTVYPKEGGNGNMTFDFKFEKNTKPSVRTGKIKVWSGDSVFYVTVNQAEGQAFDFDKDANFIEVKNEEGTEKFTFQSNVESWQAEASSTDNWLSVSPTVLTSDATGNQTLEIGFKKNTDESQRTGEIRVWSGEYSFKITVVQARGRAFEFYEDTKFSLIGKNAGGVEKFDFISNVDSWEASSSDGWVRLNPPFVASPDGKGPKTLEITYDANDKLEERSATVTVWKGDSAFFIAINQLDGRVFDFAPNTQFGYEVGYEKDVITFTFISNVSSWQATSSDESWLKVSPTSGGKGNNQVLTITHEKSTEESKREGTITVQSGDSLFVITIKQARGEAFEFDDNTLFTYEVENSKGDTTFKFQSNVTSWEASSSADWLKLKTSSDDPGATTVSGDKGPKTLTLSYENNAEQAIREATVTVKDKNSDASFNVTVKQSRGRAFDFNANTDFIYTVNNSAGSKTFEFTSYVSDWEATSSDKSWLTVDPSSGGIEKNKRLTINYESSTVASRYGIITVKSKSLDSSFIITVNQINGRAFDFDAGTQYIYYVDNTAGERTFKFRSNVAAWTTVSSGSWLRAEPASKAAPGGQGTHTLTLKFEKSADVAQRMGTITVKSGDSLFVISVIQSRGRAFEFDENTVFDYEVGNTKGDTSFTFQSNVENWEATCPELWLDIKVEPELGGIGQMKLILEYAKSEEETERTGKITVQSGDSIFYINVKQVRGRAFEFYDDTEFKYEVGSLKGDTNFVFQSNVTNWIAISSDGWLKVSTDAKDNEKKGKMTLKLEYEKNLNDSKREGTITVKSGDGDSTFVIKVEQARIQAFEFDESAESTYRVGSAEIDTSFTFQSNVENWTATSSNTDWLTITSTDGGGKGQKKLKFHCEENKDEARSAEITVQSGEATLVIKVEQARGRVFEFDADVKFLQTVRNEDGNMTFAFKSKVDSWEAKSSDESWLTVTPTSMESPDGLGDQTLEIAYYQSEDNAERSATITVWKDDSSFVITVNQIVGRAFEFADDTKFEYEVGNAKGTETFAFKSNVAAWEAISSDEWLSVKPASKVAPDGKGDMQLTIEYEKSEEQAERTGTITVQSGDSTFVIKVKQARGRAFEFDDNTVFEYNISNSGADTTFKFQSNVTKWDAITSDDKWLTVKPTTGGKDKIELTLTITKNTNQSEREGTITVTDGDSTFVIKVKQSGGRAFDFTSDTEFAYNVKNTAGYKTFKFQAYVEPWTATSSNEQWLTVSPAKGVKGNDITLTINYEANAQLSRDGTITVTDGDSSFVITVNQLDGRVFEFAEDAEFTYNVGLAKADTTFKFKSNVTKWDAISSDKSWLSVDPTSGGKDEITLKIGYEQCNDESGREGTITVKSGDSTFVITVKQSRQRAFEFEENAEFINVENAKGDTTFQFKANVDRWETEASSTGNWLSVKDPISGGKGKNTLTLEFEKNEDESAREGKIKVWSGDSVFYVTVRQARGRAFDFYDNTNFLITVGSEESYKEFAFKSYVENWSVTPSQTWLTVTTEPKEGGKGEMKLTINYKANTQDSRAGTVTVKSGDSTFVITVNQLKGRAFDFDAATQFSYDVDNAKDYREFTFTANVTKWEAFSSDISWLTVSPTSGGKGKDKVLRIDFEKNEDASKREGTITVKSGDSLFVITIKQAAGRAFEYEENTEFIPVENTKGETTFMFKSNVTEWTAKSLNKWLSVKPESGDKGQKKLTIEYEKNEDQAERTGEIVVQGGESTFTITVTQARGRAFEFKENTEFTYQVESPKGSKTFAFKANVSDWTATSSNEKWLTVDKTSGDKGDIKLNIAYEKNTAQTKRLDSITVKKGDSSFVIRVEQARGRVFEFDENTEFTYKVGNTKGDTIFAFHANVTNWTATSTQKWLTVKRASDGKGNDTVKLEYAKSEEQTERTAKVIVQYNDSLFEIKVTQACGRAFEFDENAEFIHTAKTFAGEKSFAFKSNVPSWEATSSDKWLSVDRTLGGKGDFVLTISYENSTSQEERSATITVKSKNSDSSFVITVNQLGGRVFEFNEGTEFSFEVGNTKGTKTFNFKSNVSAWSTASSGGWLTADPSSLLAPDGKGNHTLTLKYDKSTEESTREGRLTVKSGDSSFVIKIKQARGRAFEFDENTKFEYEVDSPEDSTEFTFTSNVASWKVECEQSWLTVKLPEIGTGSKTLILKSAKSTEQSIREAVVKVTGTTANSKDSSFVIKIKQARGRAFEFDEDAKFLHTVQPPAGEKYFKFKSNVPDWEAKSSDPSWLTVKPSRGGKESYTLTLFYLQSGPQEERSATVTVTDGDSSFVITVNQLSGRAFDFNEGTEFTYEVEHTQGDTTFDFQSNVAKWEATSLDKWLRVEPTSGDKGAKTLRIEYDPNDDDERVGKIKVHSGDSTFEVTIKQARGEAFEFYDNTQYEYKVGYLEGKQEFAFKSHVTEWEATSSDKWLSVDVDPESGGKGAMKLTLKYSKSDEQEERVGTITVTSAYSSFVITVKQARGRAFDFDENTEFTYQVEGSKGTRTFTFQPNVMNWTTISSDTWLRVNPASGNSGRKTLIIEFDENTAQTKRTGEIKFKKGDSTFVITVEQARGRVFNFDENAVFTYEVGNAKGDTTFMFHSNVADWKAESLDEWLSVNPTSGGIGDDTLKIAFQKNVEQAERIGTIKVSKGDSTFSVVIKQARGEAFEFDKDAQFLHTVQPPAGEKLFTFISNVDHWTATSSDESWLKIDKKSGGKDQITLKISYMQSTLSGERSGTITVTDGTSSFVITVNQLNGRVFDFFDDTQFEYEVEYPEGNRDFAFKSNVSSWTTESSDDWLSVSPASKAIPDGKGNQYLKLYFKKSSEQTERIGTIKVMSGDSSFVITVKQARGLAFEFDENTVTYHVKNAAGDTAFKFQANVDEWTAESSKDWLTFPTAEGSSKTTSGKKGQINLDFQYDASQEETERSAEITVTGGGSSFVVTVNQARGRAFEFDENVDFLIAVDQFAGNRPFKFKSNVAKWEAIPSEKWLSVSPMSGGNDDIELTIYYESTNQASRSGTITVTDGDSSFVITVNQLNGRAFEFDDNTQFSYDVENPAGTIDFKFKSNVTDWRAISSDDWLSVEPTASPKSAGKGNMQLKLAYAKNTEQAKRTGTITVKSGDSTFVIEVNQARGRAFEFKANTEFTYQVAYLEDDTTFTFLSNVDIWTASSSERWLDVTPSVSPESNGKGEKTLTFKYEKNTDPSIRTAIVTVQSGDSLFTVAVEQEKGRAFEIDPNTPFAYDLDRPKGDTIFKFRSNVEKWTAESSEDWLTLKTAKEDQSATSIQGDKGDIGLILDYAKNTVQTERTATVTVYKGNESFKITVTQARGQAFEFESDVKFNFDVDYLEGYDTVTFYSNVTDWKAVTNDKWLIPSTNYGQTGTIVFSFKHEKNVDGSARTGKITISNILEPDSFFVITVRQTSGVSFEFETGTQFTRHFENEGGEQVFRFHSNVDEWTTSVSTTATDKDWLKVTPAVSPESGGKGDIDLKLTCKESKESSDRTAIVTVQSGNASFEITVTQSQGRAFEFDADVKFSYSEGFEAGDNTFTFYSNITEWVAQTSHPWLTLKTANGGKSQEIEGKAGKHTLTFYFEKSEEQATRSATIKVRGKDDKFKDSTFTVTVSQSQGQPFEFEPGELFKDTVDYPAGNNTFKFKANVENWTATSDKNWLTFDNNQTKKTGVKGDITLGYKFPESKEELLRTATVTVKDDNSEAEFKFTVSQRRGRVFEFEPNTQFEFPVEYPGKEFIFKFRSNANSWVTGEKDGKDMPKWVKLSDLYGGIGNFEITITCEKSVDEQPREANIKFSGTSASADSFFIVTIKQERGPAFEFQPNTQFVDTVDNTEGETTFKFHPNVSNWAAKSLTANTNNNWLTVDPATGTGGATAGYKTLTIGFAKNTADTTRTDTIVVQGITTYSKDSLFKVAITQKRGRAFEFNEGTELNPEVDSPEGEYEFKFISNIESWAASTKTTNGWLRITSSPNKGTGEKTIKYKANKSTLQTKRTDTIFVRGAANSRSKDSVFYIAVTQQRGRAFEFQPNTKFKDTVDYHTGSNTFKFQANVAEWIATSDQSWLTFTNTKKTSIEGKEGQVNLQFDFAESKKETPRTAKVTVKSKNSDSTFTFTVTQVRGRAFEFEPNVNFTYNLDNIAQDTGFTFHANAAYWSVSRAEKSWLTEVLPEMGKEGQNRRISIKVPKNTMDTSRTDTIFVEGVYPSDDSTFMVRIIQKRGRAFEFNDNVNFNPNVDFENGTTYFYFFSNIPSWKATSDQDWLTFGSEKTKTTSGEDGLITLELHYEKSEEQSDRTAKVTVQGQVKDGNRRSKDSTFTFMVTQSQGRAFEFDNNVMFSYPEGFEAGNNTFSFQANIDWVATTSQSWLTLETANGGKSQEIEGKAGKPTLTFYFDKSEEQAERSAEIKVRGKEDAFKDSTFTIRVSQSQGKPFEFEPGELFKDTVDYHVGSNTFKFRANVDKWTATSDQDWLTFDNSKTKTGTKGNIFLEYDFVESKAENFRTATVTVVSEDGLSEFHFTVTQKRGRAFEFEPNTNFTYQMDNIEKDTTFKFYANVANWLGSIKSNVNWLYMHWNTGTNGEQDFKFHVNKNTDETSRKDTITISGIGQASNDSLFHIIIEQKRGRAFEFASDVSFQYGVNFEGVKDTIFNFQSNVANWKATSDQDWVTVKLPEKTDKGYKELKITCEKSTAQTSRTAKIKVIANSTLTPTSFDSSFVITITQAQGKAFEFDPDVKDEFEEDYTAKELSFPFQANVAWKATSNKSWLTLGPNKQASINGSTGKQTLKLNLAKSTEQQARSAEVVVTETGTNPKPTTFTIKVTQGRGLAFEFDDDAQFIYEFNNQAVKDTFFTFQSNIESWAVTHLNKSWLTLTTTSGGKGTNNKLKFSVAESKDDTTRVDTITVRGTTAQTKDSVFYIAIAQSRGRAFEFEANTQFAYDKGNEAGTIPLTFTSNVQWTVNNATKPAWVKVTPKAYGEIAGKEYNINFEYEKNTGERERTANIKIQGDGFSIDSFFIVSIKQKRGVVFEFEPNTQFVDTVDYLKGKTSFNFTSNVTWVANTNSSWLSLTEETTGSGPSTLVIDYPKHLGDTMRTDSIIVKGFPTLSQDSTFKLKITQRRGNAFEFNEGTNFSPEVDGAGGEYEFKFTSNVAWDTVITQTSKTRWLSIIGAIDKKAGARTIRFKATKSTLQTSRTDTIFVKGAANSKSKDSVFYIAVIQAPGRAFEFQPNTKFADTVNYLAGNKTFNFQSNVANWTATSNQKWLTFGTNKTNKFSGKTGAINLRFNFDESKEETPRTAEVTVKSDDSDSTFRFTVTQKRGRAFEFEPNTSFTYELDNIEHDTAFKFYSNTEFWSASLKRNKGWLRLNQTMGMRETTDAGAVILSSLPFRLDKNRADTARIDTIVVKGMNLSNDSTFRIVVKQKRGRAFEFNDDVTFTPVVDFEGGQTTFTFFSNITGWKATTGESWLTFKDKKREITGKNGQITLELDCEKSEAQSERTATVTVVSTDNRSKDSTFTFTVKQAQGKPFEFDVDVKNNFEEDYTAKELSFPFQANVTWKATSNKSWLTLGQNKLMSIEGSTGKQTLKLNLEKSTEQQARTAEVEVIEIGNTNPTSFTITVTQAKGQPFEFEPNEDFSIDEHFAAGKGTFNFQANVAQWKATSDQDWLTFDNTTKSTEGAKGNIALKYNFTENTGELLRTAHIKVENKSNSKENFTVSVNQKRGRIFEFEPNAEFSFEKPNTAGQITIKFHSNAMWKIATPKWVTSMDELTGDKTEGFVTITFDYTKNTEEFERIDTIKLQGTGTLSKDSIYRFTIKQARGLQFEFEPNTQYTYHVGNIKDDTTFKFHANVETWKANVKSSKGWLKIKKDAGDQSARNIQGDKGDIELIFDYTKNTADSARIDTVVVRAFTEQSKDSFKVAVVQARGRAFEFNDNTDFNPELPYTQTTKSFTFTSNIGSWNATPTSTGNWLSITSGASGNAGGKNISYKAVKNATESARTGTIKVKGAANSRSKDSTFTITVTQGRGPAFEFQPNTKFEYEVPNTENITKFTFTSNISGFKATATNTSGTKWLTVSPESVTGSGSKTLDITAAKNESESAREDTIYVRGIPSGLSKDSVFFIVIKQRRGNAFEFEPNTQFVYKDLSGDGGTIPFTFKYNIDSWQTKIGNNNDWLSVKEPYGSRSDANHVNGKQTVIITYAPSTSEEVRTDSIVFLGAGNSKDSTFVVRLTQKRGRAFDFLPNTNFNPTIENTEGQMTFVFKANVSGWNATATSTNNWLKLADNSQSGGSGDKTLRISYEKNIADTSRTATIKVKGVGPSSDSSFVVTITQERGRAFDFDAGKVFEYHFANNKVDTSFTFYSYIKAWNASATKQYSTWLSGNISPTSTTNGIGKKSIKINVPKNTLETPRTDTIIVRGANNSLSKDSIFRVAINQERGRAFEFSDNTQFTRTLPSAGTPSQSFTFTSNISKWKIQSKPTWLTVTTNSSYTTTGSKTLTISAANYTGETAREGDIIIKGDNTLSGDSTFTIHVVQKRGNAFEFDPGTQFVYKDLSGNGGTISFTFKYNIDSWQTKIDNKNDWISVKEPYGSRSDGNHVNGKQTVIITYAPSTSEEVRTDSIIFLGAGNSKDSTFVVKLTQKRGKVFEFQPNTDFDLELPNTAGRKEFDFTVNTRWEATTKTTTAAWVTPKTKDNYNAGDRTLYIDFNKNTLETPRFDTITVKATTLQSKDSLFKIALKQVRGRAFEFNDNTQFEFPVPNTEKTNTFKFNANVNWDTAITKTTGTNWINITSTLNKTSGSNKTIQFKTLKNITETPRTDTIKVKGTSTLSKDSVFYIIAKQDRGQAFEFQPNTKFEYTFPNSAKDTIFTFVANAQQWEAKTPWDGDNNISEDAKWLKINTVNTTGTDTIKIHINRSTAELDRQATITVKGKEGTPSEDSVFYIKITQKRGQAFEFQPDTKFEYEVDDDKETEITFNFTANLEMWVATKKATWINWVNESYQGGRGKGTITLKTLKNETEAVRKDTIKVSGVSVSADSTFRIIITQKRKRAFDFEPDVDFEPTFDFPKGQSTFKFKANVAKWKATIPSTSPWLTFGEEKANEITGERTDVTLQLNFDKSEEETAREAIITVTATTAESKDSTFQVKVTQNRGPAFEFDSDFEFYRPLFFTEDDTTFNFQANVKSWKATSSDPSWLTVTTPLGADKGNKTIKINHARNTSELQSRTATITVTATTTESEDSTFVIEVEQYVKGTFLAGKNNIIKKIKFAPGNLQYCATQDKWRFAERQFDRCGVGDNVTTVYWDNNGVQTKCDNSQMSETYGGWIDMFSWSSSGISGGVPPYNSSGGSPSSFLSDWGGNIIGDYPANTWRTMDNDEMNYVVQRKGVVNHGGQKSYLSVRLKYGANDSDTLTGVILLPNEFTWEKAGVQQLNMSYPLPINIDLSTWNALDAVGCVFLPSNSYSKYGSAGLSTPYWSCKDQGYGKRRGGTRIHFFAGRTFEFTELYSYQQSAVRLIRDLE